MTNKLKQVGGKHYQEMKIDVIDFCHINNIPFNEGSAIKYLCRWRKKNGVEDLKKARNFIDRIIEKEEANLYLDKDIPYHLT